MSFLRRALRLFQEDGELRERLSSSPSVPIASLCEATIGKVTGTIHTRDGAQLIAPLTGRACVFYEVVVEEAVSGVDDTTWIERVHDRKRVDFDVVDDTGVIEVRTQGMEPLLTPDLRHDIGPFHDAPPALEAYLQRHGTTSVGFDATKRMRYRETVLDVGERVAVLGQVGFEEDPAAVPAAGSYRGVPRRPFLTDPPQRFLLVQGCEGKLPRSMK